MKKAEFNEGDLGSLLFAYLHSNFEVAIDAVLRIETGTKIHDIRHAVRSDFASFLLIVGAGCRYS